jgi:hypothetical protein
MIQKDQSALGKLERLRRGKEREGEGAGGDANELIYQAVVRRLKGRIVRKD